MDFGYKSIRIYLHTHTKKKGETFKIIKLGHIIHA